MMRQARSPALFVAATLVVVALVVPAAGAGSNDEQAIHAVAARYTAATTSGSSLACRLMTANAQKTFVYLGSMLAKTKLAGCPAAVKAIAKLNESQFPSHEAYVRSGTAMLQAIARARVVVRGSHASLKFTVVSGFGSASSTLDFALVQGHWLVGG